MTAVQVPSRRQRYKALVAGAIALATYTLVTDVIAVAGMGFDAISWTKYVITIAFIAGAFARGVPKSHR